MLFVGRIEKNKGVLDLIAIAERLEQEFPGQLQFDICGNGSDQNELVRSIEERRLGGVVHYLGRLNRQELLKVYGRSHLSIVPTRSTFCEGMPLVLAEAVITGRPAITSRVTNALEVLGDAIVEAKTDDVESYVSGIRRLLTDEDYYRELCAACPPARQQFFDREKGWSAAFDRLIRSFDPTTPVPFQEALG